MLTWALSWLQCRSLHFCRLQHSLTSCTASLTWKSSWWWGCWWWGWGFCTCNRPVRCSSLCISPCGIFCLPADHDVYYNAVVDQRNDTADKKSYEGDADLLLALTTSPLALSWEFQNYTFNTFHHVLENSNGYFFIKNYYQHHQKCHTSFLIYLGIRKIKLIAWDQLPQVIISALSKVASSKPGSRVITKAMTRHDIRYDNQKW